jgi:hypothetical protein
VSTGRRSLGRSVKGGQLISDKWSHILVPTDPFEGFDRFGNIGLAGRVKVLSINSQWAPDWKLRVFLAHHGLTLYQSGNLLYKTFKVTIWATRPRNGKHSTIRNSVLLVDGRTKACHERQ